MATHRVLLSTLALVLLSAPAFSQDTKPSTTPAPAATSPMSTAKPSTTGAATAAVTGKINLNTATVAQLDKLPKITPAQSKAIVEARAKTKFKDWNDFVARKVVPADTAAAIKEDVSF
jgi:DNA uptake protein ComE-like DNA-binding protein